MKVIPFLILLIAAQTASAQDETCDYKISKTGEGKYKTVIPGFDSLSRGETCFLGWMNTGRGKPDGELLVYDGQGRKRRLAIYRGGIRVGRHLEWYATGELYSETNWETDLYFNSKSYYKSGKLENTAVNGNRENAVYTSYYESGAVQTVIDYAAHIDKTWYANGQLEKSRSDTGRVYTEWHSNGKVRLTGLTDADRWRRTGKWSYYNAQGKLVKELFYKPGNVGWYGTEEGFYKAVKY